MKAMNFNEEIPALPNDFFTDHYVLVFDLTSLQDAGENVHYPELSRESLRLEMFFERPLTNVTERTNLNCSRRTNLNSQN